MSHGDAPLAFLELARIAQLGKRIFTGVGDLHQPRIEGAKQAQRFPFDRATVVEREFALLPVGPTSNVRSGQHVTVLADDDAAAPSWPNLHPHGAFLHLFRKLAYMALHGPQVGHAD